MNNISVKGPCNIGSSPNWVIIFEITKAVPFNITEVPKEDVFKGRSMFRIERERERERERQTDRHTDR